MVSEKYEYDLEFVNCSGPTEFEMKLNELGQLGWVI